MTKKKKNSKKRRYKSKKEKIREEDAVHIKLDIQEGIQSRKDVLSTMVSLLKMIQVMKNYHQLRSKELEIKIEMRKRLKLLRSHLSETERKFPKLKIPELLKEEKIEEKEERRKIVKIPIREKIEEKPKDDIESQLQDIQSKLRSISN